jgi:hypothetical protein
MGDGPDAHSGGSFLLEKAELAATFLECSAKF